MRDADFKDNLCITSANFGNMDLRGADFRGADIRWCEFICANLAGADFRGAIGVETASFIWADVSGARFDDSVPSDLFDASADEA